MTGASSVSPLNPALRLDPRARLPENHRVARPMQYPSRGPANRGPDAYEGTLLPVCNLPVANMAGWVGDALMNSVVTLRCCPTRRFFYVGAVVQCRRRSKGALKAIVTNMTNIFYLEALS